MIYPTISQYIESIKDAEDNFATLTNLRPVMDEDGNPIMSSGNFAVVFKMKDNQTGKFYAVKCFIKEQKDREKNYRMIADELEYITPTTSYLTNFQYLEKELFVDTNDEDNNEFPVLLMDWVDGVTLDKYIRNQIKDKYALGMLAYRFILLAIWLIPQPFAHGDIKPDNILVKEDGNLVLVDYDGMYVPAMKGQKARELGSPDFRHPSRTDDDFDERIDDFPIVSILLSIQLIADDTTLLKQYSASDRLLFSENDYCDIKSCKLLKEIFPSSDYEVNTLVGLFVIALSKGTSLNFAFLLYELQSFFKDSNTILVKAMRGDAEAQNEIGGNYFSGSGVIQSYSEAVRWYRKAAVQGIAVAQNDLGFCYYNGRGVTQDYSEAVKWYRKAAEQGNAKAQNNLGLCYKNGKGVSQDYSEAVKWYRKAAEQGNAKAQNNLGLCYKNGKGVSQDYSEAVKWYRKAAEQGNAKAQNNLGLCYKNGKGVSQDYYEAVKWYRKAAEQGIAVAQTQLGYCYYNGSGVSQDYVEAVKWYRKAAEHGNNVAQNYLGFCYYSGRGISQDYEEAVNLFRKAAEQGNVTAQCNLGFCYYDGRGVGQNIPESIRWYQKAAEQGNEKAKAKLKSLTE